MTTVTVLQNDGTRAEVPAETPAKKPRAPRKGKAEAPVEGTPDTPEGAVPDGEVPVSADAPDAAPKAGKGPKNGLDAPRGRVTYLMFPEDLHIVGVDDDVRDPADPLFDERAVRMAAGKHPFFDQMMIDDIDTNGVVSPIKVVKDGNIIKVNAGRRRTFHARKANELRVARGDVRLRVEVMVEKGSDRDLFLAARRENVYRVQDDVVLDAENMARALRLHSTEEEVAAAFSTTVKTVRERLKILELSVVVRQAIAVGEISATAALVAMRDVPRKAQDARLKELLAAGGATVAELTAESKRRKRGGDVAPPADDGDGDGEQAAKIKPPGKRAMSKLLLSMEENKAVPKACPFPDDEAARAGFKACLRWVLGDCGPKGVTGLTKALRDAGVKV